MTGRKPIKHMNHLVCCGILQEHCQRLSDIHIVFDKSSPAKKR